MGPAWLVTGPPGAGKSTLVSKVILRLKSAGVIVGGVLTSERRAKGARLGFDIVDLTDGLKGELASAGAQLGPRVGRYRVNLRDLARVGGGALTRAARVSEVIVIDELGPMELISPEFRKGVRDCIDSNKPILAVAHERLEDELLEEVKGGAVSTIILSVDNRDAAADQLAADLLTAAGGPKTA